MYTAYGFAAFSILIGLVSLFYPPPNWNNFFRYLSAVALILLVCKLLGSSFLLIDDVIRLFRWIFSLFKHKGGEVVDATQGISRLKFFSQLAVTFTIVPAVGFLYGMVRGAYKYRVHNVKVPSPNLPPEFDGFKIVQLSDIHSGSFMNENALIKAFDIVKELKADIILFTGDLVNNVSTEVDGYEHLFKQLSAPHGVFSVLGNHDYGDYVEWDSTEAKRANLELLKAKQKDFGWKLLMNEHVPIEKDGATIGLIGIENWGGNMRFPRYGKMKEAYEGAENYAYKILMSHDPSHWDMQVVLEYPEVDLTLSGHTHGMQFGIEIPGFKWSPIKYLYKNWAGLYKQGKQFLYVNRGLGFLGYPGRLGIWPEITVIELQKT
ncbi:metallophosphoesterase [Sediminibacterium sp.]|uniref:metallophosphoesterase n=1 Tax=Sediminibacterium sp. TaxID=1917865 RepID=UPI00273406ED|nr:metallophosphoesterase [Sediminibacterium sp.]MDP3567369.1 metallophosphoesterase [Sediminibacterium sp.]